MNRSIFAVICLLILPIVITIASMTSSAVLTTGGTVEVTFTWYDLLLIPVILAYGLYPIAYSTEKLFRPTVIKKIINEYRWIKYIMYFEIPILFISVVILIPLLYDPSSPNTDPFGSLISFSWSVLAGIIWILIIRKKGYQFYFAKAYVTKCLENNDSISRIKEINRGLDYYNNFLQVNISSKIDNINEIKTKFSSGSVEEQNNIIRLLSEAFESSDRVKPREVLRNSYNVQIAQVSQIDRIKRMFSEKGIVITLVLPIAGIAVSIYGSLPKS